MSLFILRSTKCELAKVMNQQTCYQELIQQKDQTIRGLERKASTSHMNGSLKKEAKTRYEFLFESANILPETGTIEADFVWDYGKDFSFYHLLFFWYYRTLVSTIYHSSGTI